MSFIDHYRYMSGTILMLFISGLILSKEQDLDLNYNNILFKKIFYIYRYYICIFINLCWIFKTYLNCIQQGYL